MPVKISKLKTFLSEMLVNIGCMGFSLIGRKSCAFSKSDQTALPIRPTHSIDGQDL